MGFLSFLSSGGKGDINALVEEARGTEGALLVDVRTPGEFERGHVPGAYNVPLQQIDLMERAVPDHATPLYLYCASGARSGTASRRLSAAGYKQVCNMGGFSSWRGPVEKGAN